MGGDSVNRDNINIGYDVPDTDPRLANLDRMQRVLVQTKMQGEIKYRKGVHLTSDEEDLEKWVYSLPRTNSIKLKRYLQ